MFLCRVVCVCVFVLVISVRVSVKMTGDFQEHVELTVSFTPVVYRGWPSLNLLRTNISSTQRQFSTLSLLSIQLKLHLAIPKSVTLKSLLSALLGQNYSTTTGSSSSSGRSSSRATGIVIGVVVVVSSSDIQYKCLISLPSPEKIFEWESQNIWKLALAFQVTNWWIK